jgi:hypothetical protein
VANRPTSEWSEGIAEEARLVAAGALEKEFAVMAELFPPDLLRRFDEIFDAFEREVAGLIGPLDGEVIAIMRNVVYALNALNEDYDFDAIATGERTVLCEYIDQTISEAGVNLDVLSARHGVPREDLTDEWRTW